MQRNNKISDVFEMNLVRFARVLIPGAMILGSALANANTVTYILDQSNALDDNVDYLSVMITDDTEGQLDFRVTTLSALSELAGENYGIQSFGLDLLADLLPGDESGEDQFSSLDFLLPEGWRVQFDKGMSEAGMFDVRIFGTGSSRLDPLEFSVTGLDLDDIPTSFAAHVAGFEFLTGECEPGDGEREFEGESGNESGCGALITSAFFYGGRPAEVPLPPAIILLLSGLLAMAGFARRPHS
jgi:hypothetical protein